MKLREHVKLSCIIFMALFLTVYGLIVFDQSVSIFITDTSVQSILGPVLIFVGLVITLSSSLYYVFNYINHNISEPLNRMGNDVINLERSVAIFHKGETGEKMRRNVIMEEYLFDKISQTAIGYETVDIIEHFLDKKSSAVLVEARHGTRAGTYKLSSPSTVFVISGEVERIVDDTVHQLGQWDFLKVDPDAVQCGIYHSDATILIVVSPPIKKGHFEFIGEDPIDYKSRKGIG